MDNDAILGNFIIIMNIKNFQHQSNIKRKMANTDR